MPRYGWRALLGFSAVPLILFTFACKWLPESPRFHMLSGNPEKALVTLEKVARMNGKTLPPGRLVAAGAVQSRGSMKDLLAPPMRNTSLLLWIIWFACAFAYYGIVLMTTEILQEMKEGTCDAKDQCSFNCQDLDQVLFSRKSRFIRV
jgi:MFS family permease